MQSLGQVSGMNTKPIQGVETREDDEYLYSLILNCSRTSVNRNDQMIKMTDSIIIRTAIILEECPKLWPELLEVNPRLVVVRTRATTSSNLWWTKIHHFEQFKCQ